MAESIYESLGVRTVIDAWGTVTALGGSLMAPEVLQAMQSAAGSFVDMSELHAEQAGASPTCSAWRPAASPAARLRALPSRRPPA